MTTSNQWMGYGLTHVGQVRKSNQDIFLIDDKRGLWIVADGMGNHARSDIASQLAIETIQESIASSSFRRNKANSKWLILLENTVVKANSTIHSHARDTVDLKGIGTTVVFMFMPDPEGEKAYIVHVGDSRAYLIRDQQLISLTRDHTLLEEYIQAGLLPKTTSSNHPLGHVLGRALGVGPTVKPEISNLELQPNDTILLCSDGLIKMMKDKQILETLQKPSSQAAKDKCQLLIDEANRLGGKDNTTVVLIEAQE